MPGCAVCSLDGAAVVVTVLRSGRSSPFWKLSDRVATWMSWMGLMRGATSQSCCSEYLFTIKIHSVGQWHMYPGVLFIKGEGVCLFDFRVDIDTRCRLVCSFFSCLLRKLAGFPAAFIL